MSTQNQNQNQVKPFSTRTLNIGTHNYIKELRYEMRVPTHKVLEYAIDAYWAIRELCFEDEEIANLLKKKGIIIK